MNVAQLVYGRVSAKPSKVSISLVALFVQGTVPMSMHHCSRTKRNLTEHESYCTSHAKTKSAKQLCWLVVCLKQGCGTGTEISGSSSNI